MNLGSTRRIISEMSKSAEKRIYNRLIDPKKMIYATGKFIDQTPPADHRDINKLKAKLKMYMSRNGFQWENYCRTMNELLGINPESMTSYYDFKRKFEKDPQDESQDSKWAKLYKRIKRTIDVHKDDIDKNYIDKFNEFNTALRKKTLDDAYTETHFAPFIEWFRENPDEAQDRFGTNYPIVKRKLARWLDPDYQGSDIQVLDDWDDYTRLKNARVEATLSEETLYRLAELVQRRDAARVIGNADKAEWLKTTVLPPLFPNNRLPTPAQCRAFLNGDSPKRKIERLINAFPVDLNTQFNIKDVTKRFFNDAGEDIYEDGVIEDAIGAVSADTVKAVCRYCMSSLNRRYITNGTKPFPFNSVQQYYDAYKPVFKLGLTEENFKKLFEKYAEAIKAALEA